MLPPPVFLDRDGTLIVERDYLRDPERVCLEKGAVEGLAMLRQHGHPLVVLSNQSGIGRGLLTERDAQQVNARTAELLRPSGIEILAWYFCPHTPEQRCDCRKPLPGMAYAASRDLRIELCGSYVIGDKRSDLELADVIGGQGILVRTGYGSAHVDWARAATRPVADGLPEAAAFIIEHAHRRRNA